MAEQAVRPSSVSANEPVRSVRWRTVDIVVAAVLGVAFGVVFWAWNLVAALAVPPVSGLLNGVYLMPGVVAGLLVRKPGAATFASTLAATVSILLGSPYGAIIIFYGLVQGLGGELGFLLTGYRRVGWGAPRPAGGAAGGSAAVPGPSPFFPGSSGYPLLALPPPHH